MMEITEIKSLPDVWLGFTSFKDVTVISESNICVRISLQYKLHGTEGCFREKVISLNFLKKLHICAYKYMGYTSVTYTYL